ncbi:hypothetical protein BO78DRAFT_386407 [Aspergillus sclerotiicarbonarius CBS 121057]|uniref:Uncharacterized protein n=1 Tax=Aspergillus sclerotiicarbonarius (strain CBS 121057 / IBT 28362) TaxID=1448318 RepID=A0A319EA31_ASPSB|nr:hypothetical protein BO78DRAFT_386407 [Aspergillus sclerotiicarbonarius CBS 121057]
MLTIDSLSGEVRRQISLFVVNHSWHDLSALSQTSRTWYDLVTPELYRDFRIKFHSLSSLQEDIAELDVDGLGRQYLKYARNLELVCLEEPSWLETKRAHFKSQASQNAFLQDSLTECRDHDLRFLYNTAAPYRRNGYPPSTYRPYGDERNDYQQKNWEPIITLLVRFQHLPFFNYVVKDIFPTFLYEALELSHPTCHLNIWTSQCLSPEQPLDHINILQAPTLHTIKMVYKMGVDLQDRSRWVHLDEPFLIIHLHGPEWQEFTGSNTKPSPAVISLESLTFADPDARRPLEHILLNISTMIDLSRLRSLDVGVYAEPTLLAQVASTLTNLERLYVNMGSRGQYKLDDNTSDVQEMIIAVQAFRPLRYLCLRGLRSLSSVGLLLEASDTQRRDPDDEGRKYPITEGDHVRLLAQSCPLLEELRLPLQRTQGNGQECDIYRAIGQSWPRLRIVVLDFDCHPTSRQQEQQDEEEDETTPSPAYLREILINAAIDEILVTSIFNLMCSRQPTQTLRHLRINLTLLNLFTSAMDNVIRQISRSFLVTRPELDPDVDSGLQVQEIGRVAWQLWREWNRLDGPVRIPKQLKDVLEELWPLNSDRNGSKSWKELPLLVKSFPLEDTKDC